MLIFLLLTVVAAQNLNIDVNSSTGSYQNFNVSWVLTQRNSVIFNIISKQPGYFALMYSQSMTNSDLTAVQLVNGTGLARDYYSTNHSRPTIYKRASVNTISVTSDGSSYVQAIFERPFITSYPGNMVLTDGGVVMFALAWNPSNPRLSFHGRNLLYIYGSLLNNSLITITPNRN